jgi:hypothetical protein
MEDAQTSSASSLTLGDPAIRKKITNKYCLAVWLRILVLDHLGPGHPIRTRYWTIIQKFICIYLDPTHWADTVPMVWLLQLETKQGTRQMRSLIWNNIQVKDTSKWTERNNNKKKKKKTRNKPGMVAHAFNPSTWEAEAVGFLSSRPAWSTKWVPGQLGLYRETLGAWWGGGGKKQKQYQTGLVLWIPCYENCSSIWEVRKKAGEKSIMHLKMTLLNHAPRMSWGQ